MSNKITKYKYCLFCMFFLGWTAFLGASSIAQMSQENPPRFALKDLKIGMKGQGITVFSSVKGLETFDFEVLGVLKNSVGYAQDMIIVRLLGERFKKSITVAGMSGSPAFIDGKLLGAVSYRFGDFLTEGAIAGITSIDSMLAAASFENDNLGSKSQEANFVQLGQMKTIGLALVASGLSPQVVEHFKQLFAQRGYGVLTSGGGSLSSDEQNKAEQRFYPGGPIATVLIDGSIKLAGIGTVTWVNHDKFLAFGHPFLETGFSEVPVANAEIITTLFSQKYAHKLGQATQTIGVLTDDRNVAVAGFMGKRAVTTELSVRLGKASWKYQISRHPRDTALFASLALGQSLTKRVNKESGGTYRLNIKVQLTSGEMISFEKVISGYALPLEMKVADEFRHSVQSLTEQDFKIVSLSKIEVDVKYQSEVMLGSLETANAGLNMQSGKSSSVIISYKPLNENIKSLRTEVKVPRGLSPGKYEILVAGSEESSDFEMQTGLSSVPQNYKMLLANLKAAVKQTEVCIYLQKNNLSKRVEGVALTGLPVSLRQLTDTIAVSPESVLTKEAYRLSCVDLKMNINGRVLGPIFVFDEDYQ